MKKLTHLAGAAGLAANQVNSSKALLVYTNPETGEMSEICNPEIISTSEATEDMKEGCLSYPGIYLEVSRYTEITVKYQDIEGTKKTENFSGPVAHILQHEIDHLQGIEFTKNLSRLKKDVINRKLKKFKKKVDTNRIIPMTVPAEKVTLPGSDKNDTESQVSDSEYYDLSV